MELQDVSKPGEFCWNELTTTDSAGAFQFYSQLFGWKILEEMDMGPLGKYRIFGQGDQRREPSRRQRARDVVHHRIVRAGQAHPRPDHGQDLARLATSDAEWPVMTRFHACNSGHSVGINPTASHGETAIPARRAH